MTVAPEAGQVEAWPRAATRAAPTPIDPGFFSTRSTTGQEPVRRISPGPADSGGWGEDPRPSSPPAPHPAWDRAPWLTALREIPADGQWPRLMTLPHPRAVGSYGAEMVAWTLNRTGRELRWWQRLSATRILEHDEAGALVWLEWLNSTARQVGKSWLLRELNFWRLHQADRFGEPQLVLHTGKDLPVCREVQRPIRAWARVHRNEGYVVREVNGLEEVEAPGGSRWLVRGRGSVYGYSASMAVVDEAWKVAVEVVEDGVTPTMAERASPQLGLVSTAHRMATALMLDRRQTAIAELMAPRDVLLLEWSAPRDVAIEDRTAWRLASPHWSTSRDRLITVQHRRALAGERPDDPDEPDPVESFRAQWLNIWPERRAVAAYGRPEPLVVDSTWARVAELAAAPVGPLVIAIEDYFGQGAAAAAAATLPDGRILVWGQLAARRTEAFAWAQLLAGRHPGSRLVVGASLEADPDAIGVPVVAKETAGQAQTRLALPMVRELLAAGRLVHDGGAELAEQVGRARVVESRAGGLTLVPASGRTDLLRCMTWTLHVTARLAATPAPAPFVIR
jgi:hypothetical protein